MITCKNILLTTFYIIFLWASVNSPILTKDQKKCRDNIYKEYELDTEMPIQFYFPRYNDRKYILDENFRLKLYSLLSHIDVKQYFNEVHDHIKSNGTDTPRIYCERVAKDDNEACVERLLKFFKDSDDIVVVLQVSYRTRLESEFVNMNDEDYAKKYFQYMTEIVDIYDTILTPAQFCKDSRRIARYANMGIRYPFDPETGAEPELKRSRTDSSSVLNLF